MIGVYLYYSTDVANLHYAGFAVISTQYQRL